MIDAIFDALGNPMRRSIVRILAPGPQSVGQIAGRLPISRPAVSKHLRLLENAGLVTHLQQGNRNMFRLERRGFEEARSWLQGFWDEALTRFAFIAENTAAENTTDASTANPEDKS